MYTAVVIDDACGTKQLGMRAWAPGRGISVLAHAVPSLTARCHPFSKVEPTAHFRHWRAKAGT